MVALLARHSPPPPLFDLNSGSTTGFNFLALGGSLLDSTGSSLNTGTRGSFSLGQTGQDVGLHYTVVSTGVPEIDPAGCGASRRWSQGPLASSSGSGGGGPDAGGSSGGSAAFSGPSTVPWQPGGLS